MKLPWSAGFALLAMAWWPLRLPALQQVAPPQQAGEVSAAFVADPVAAINDQVGKTWQEFGIAPAQPAADSQWCRRLFLDLLGRIPSYQEGQAFAQDKAPGKRGRWVQALLHDSQYAEDYARNWTTIWTNLLIGRSGGTQRNSFTSRDGLQVYLRECFQANKPYDTMVAELITARGTNQPGIDRFHGAVNFLTAKLEEGAAQATAATSRIFLGLQVQCTQCHNHPFNEWKQQKFWELNSFFRQTRALRRFAPDSRDLAYVELVDEDFAGESGNAEEAMIFYEERNGYLRPALPVFVDGQAIAPSGYLEDVQRRSELGKLVIRSEYLATAIVNRLWEHFLGYGFTRPVDDMGPHNPPTHPELLQQLSQQFRKNSYDLKELMRWIVLSEPYGLSSVPNASNEKLDDPSLGETPKFSRFYLRQMSAEQLYESLLVATQAHRNRAADEQEQVKARWLEQFVVAFGNDEAEESTTFNGTIPQALMMFNGELIKEATKADPGSYLRTLANSSLSRREQLNYLFQSALGRVASPAELTMANRLLAARQGDSLGALQDIWWAVLNSNEFLLIH